MDAGGAGFRGCWGRFEVNSPEMGSGSEEFHADPLAFLDLTAEVDDAAFLLFLCLLVGENQQLPVADFVLQVEQASVNVHNHCLAVLSELAAFLATALSPHPHAVEDARAAPGSGECVRAHGVIFGWIFIIINCTPACFFLKHKPPLALLVRGGSGIIECTPRRQGWRMEWFVPAFATDRHAPNLALFRRAYPR